MKALILVDFENEWITKDSEYYVGDLKDVLDNTNKLIAHARKKGFKIIFIKHVEKGSEDSFAEGSKRTEIISSLDRKKSDVVMTKYKISAFYKTSLEKELAGVDSIVVCGVLANLCVRSLVEDAYDREFKVGVVKDCCVAMDEETLEFTFKDLRATRAEVEFLSLKDFLKR
ncbi:cysteine hydrolase [Candidatus Woesearchaeota archaeon]|nr:cysteine hydrolase [Candidatus Woesearchaeota archaeon]